MLVSKKEQINKFRQLHDKCFTYSLTAEEIKDIEYFAEEYAKWHGEKVVDRCAKVAELDYAEDEGQSTSVDKQSILKVKKEL